MKKLLAVLFCLLMLVGCGTSSEETTTLENGVAKSAIDKEVEQLESYILNDQFDEAVQLVEKVKNDYAIEVDDSDSSIDYANKVILYPQEDNSYIMNAYDEDGTHKYLLYVGEEEGNSYLTLNEYSFTTADDYEVNTFYLTKSDDVVSHSAGLDVYTNGERVSSTYYLQDGSTSTAFYEDGVIVGSEYVDASGNKTTASYDENGELVIEGPGAVDDSSTTVSNGIVGTWEMNHEDGAALYMIITFNEDGTGIIDVKPNGNTFEMTYELDGSTVVVHQDGMEDDTSLTYNEAEDSLSNYTRID